MLLKVCLHRSIFANTEEKQAYFFFQLSVEKHRVLNFHLQVKFFSYVGVYIWNLYYENNYGSGL